MTMRKTFSAIALAAASALALAACSGSGTPTDDASASASEAVVPASSSVPEALENADGMQTVAEALKETGIAGVFDGKGSYTLLAPEDDAFAALGESGKELTGGKDDAALAALLKAHMLPGYVTPADISSAIDASADGQVTMPTLGGDSLTFSKSGSTITVAAPDGSQGTFDGDPIAGGESVAIPVSAVLKKI